MKKRWMIAVGAIVAVLALLVGILSLVNGYFILAPGVQLKLNGEATQEIAAFSEYKDDGAVARRGKEDLTGEIQTEGKVDVKKPGTYVLTYRLTYGSKEYTVERTVTVVDQEAPKLTLKGQKKMTVSLQSLYHEPGFTAKDRCDGKLTKQVKVKKTVEDNVMTLHYTVQDKAGNKAEAKRVVTIRDEVPPEIVLKQGNLYIPLGGEFTEPGYSATDDADGDVTDSVKRSGSIDTARTGSYTLTYTVSDRAGNQATADRVVKVYKEDNTSADRVYLTFDDGPSSNVTPRVLDILKKNHVHATFFIVNYSESEKPLIQRMIDEGHSVGIHGYSHDYAKIYANDEAAMNNIYRLHDKLLKDFNYDSRITRFPGGSSNTVSAYYNKGIMTRLARRVEKEGFEYFDWNVSSGDAAGNAIPRDEVYYNVTSGLFRGGNNVVLMHDSGAKGTTADALQGIINYARGNGYALLPITSGMRPVHHGIAN